MSRHRQGCEQTIVPKLWDIHSRRTLFKVLSTFGTLWTSRRFMHLDRCHDFPTDTLERADRSAWDFFAGLRRLSFPLSYINTRRLKEEKRSLIIERKNYVRFAIDVCQSLSVETIGSFSSASAVLLSVPVQRRMSFRRLFEGPSDSADSRRRGSKRLRVFALLRQMALGSNCFSQRNR